MSWSLFIYMIWNLWKKIVKNARGVTVAIVILVSFLIEIANNLLDIYLDLLPRHTIIWFFFVRNCYLDRHRWSVGKISSPFSSYYINSFYDNYEDIVLLIFIILLSKEPLWRDICLFNWIENIILIIFLV